MITDEQEARLQALSNWVRAYPKGKKDSDFWEAYLEKAGDLNYQSLNGSNEELSERMVEILCIAEGRGLVPRA